MIRHQPENFCSHLLNTASSNKNTGETMERIQTGMPGACGNAWSSQPFESERISRTQKGFANEPSAEQHSRGIFFVVLVFFIQLSKQSVQRWNDIIGHARAISDVLCKRFSKFCICWTVSLSFIERTSFAHLFWTPGMCWNYAQTISGWNVQNALNL